VRWLVATVAETIPETVRAVTLRLDVPDWPVTGRVSTSTCA
jgi:hypothetical protein